MMYLLVFDLDDRQFSSLAAYLNKHRQQLLNLSPRPLLRPLLY